MIINRYQIGTGKRKHDVFGVCADMTETGKEPREIARFDTLETATAVMKFMRGDVMPKEYEAIAIEALRKEGIKKEATPAVESNKGSL